MRKILLNVNIKANHKSRRDRESKLVCCTQIRTCVLLQRRCSLSANMSDLNEQLHGCDGQKSKIDFDSEYKQPCSSPTGIMLFNCFQKNKPSPQNLNESTQKSGKSFQCQDCENAPLIKLKW